MEIMIKGYLVLKSGDEVDVEVRGEYLDEILKAIETLIAWAKNPEENRQLHQVTS